MTAPCNPWDLASNLIALAEQRMDKAGIPKVKGFDCAPVTPGKSAQVSVVPVEDDSPLRNEIGDSRERPAMNTAPASDERICGYCRGTGYEPIVRHSAAGAQGAKCPACAGTGRLWTTRKVVI